MAQELGNEGVVMDCPACAAAGLLPLADLGVVPVTAGMTYADRDEALASPAAPMRLGYCPACGHVHNVAYERSLVAYDERYDNALDNSQVFRSYAAGLARRLAKDHGLRNQLVVEVGCGKGHFLVELCRVAEARGVGFDPSYDNDISDPRVSFVPEYMDWDSAPTFDFFVARHVVEHLFDPLSFLAAARRACGQRAVRGYIEVPDAVYDLDRSPWNFPYGHVSYFTATSLARLAIRAGFALLRLVRSYEGQYLSLEVVANAPTPDAIEFTGMGLRHERAIQHSFLQNYPLIVEEWQQRVRAYLPEGCVVWGAGARGLGFLNAVDPERRIPAVVDVNPGKWGHFMPVTGHEIAAPHAIPSLRPAHVVVANPAYTDEVRRDLEALGSTAEVVAA